MTSRHHAAQLDEDAVRARTAGGGRGCLHSSAARRQIDVVVDVTGSVEFGAQVILEAFGTASPWSLMNAEVDATIGPDPADLRAEHGVILVRCDGDEPGVQMNLYRWVRGLGLIPRVMGNVKGLQDPYRNPTTQQGWAERWGQNPAMVTSFADGSKISFEQAIVANATGFKVRTRGMSRGLQVRRHRSWTSPALYDVDAGARARRRSSTTRSARR